jgi:hypothetical protein
VVVFWVVAPCSLVEVYQTYVSITQIDWLTLLREIIAVRPENYTNPINTL